MTGWNTDSIAALARLQDDWTVEVEGDCLSISNDEGLDAFVYAGTSQLIAEVALFPQHQVKDTVALNELILRTHHILPLTAICIKEIAGHSYYVAFGALSVDSKESVVIEEIETLFNNVAEFLELYGEQLTEGVAS